MSSGSDPWARYTPATVRDSSDLANVTAAPTRSTPPTYRGPDVSSRKRIAERRRRNQAKAEVIWKTF